MSEELKPCPFCQSADCRVIGGPGTRGGPKYWAGCDHCSGRAWGDTEAEAIAAWNRRASPSAEGENGLTLRQAAERLLELGSKIDRATTEEEENRLCDERDNLLSMMRKADALLSSPDARREALDEVENVIREESDRLDDCPPQFVAQAICERIDSLRASVPPQKVPRATLDAVISALYESEINCGLQTFWDGGVTVWLGDDSNGRKHSWTFPREAINAAARWLHETAMQEFPDSDYAIRALKETKP